MRKEICYTALRRRLFGILSFVLALAVVLCIFFAMVRYEADIMDKNSIVGTPQNIPAENGYTSYSAPNICDIVICGNPEIDGKQVKLYLTNPKSNDVFIAAEIFEAELTIDDQGNITDAAPGASLGKSGFIRPGEYLEALELKKALSEEQTFVLIKISTYHEETRASHGFFYVNTILHDQA